MLCEICLEEYLPVEFQQLACGHGFCNTCISMCTSTVLCPHPMCPAVRSMDIVVDEADMPGLDPDLMDNEEENDAAEKHHSRIAFASRLPLVMRLEEKQRCEGRKGEFQCVNAARITLNACKHSTCFDCLEKRLQLISKFNDVPMCPTKRCSNRLTKTEVRKMSERAPNGGNFKEICAKIMAMMKEPSSTAAEGSQESRLPSRDEVRVYSSIYGNDPSTKLMYVPLVCTFGDMINAIMQVLKIDKTFVPSEIHIYIRTITESSKTKFEQVQLKQMSRKPVRDSLISDKTHLVFDLKNEITGKQL